MSRLVAWYDAHRGPRMIVIGWLITRVLMLGILAGFERFVVGDVFYYHRKINALFTAGLDRTLYEYPTPVVWILALPYGVSFGSRRGYLIAFIVLMLALDAVFTYALWRSTGRRHDTSIDFWLIFVLLIGPLSYLRFDMLPAVLAGGALLAARHKPWVTGALTGLGAAVKLWPALLIGAFLSYRSDRRPVGLAFVIVGFGLALISLIFGGWARLISPLTWQSDRGLQIESIWATPLMLARAASPDQWLVDISQYQAYEIFGPGVDVWIVISNLATLLGLTMIILLTIRAFRHNGSTPVAIGFVVVATVAIMTITNKTLSPQYLLWLGGPMAALMVLRPNASVDEQPAINRMAGQLLILALLTQLVYPLFYDGYLGRNGQLMIILSTVVTAIRNLALVVFTVEACWLAWRMLAVPVPDHTALSRQE
ncbi:MAG TPA: glycosyltransferase family 87 protein [Propionibacteriaceae bacterium]|jgi:Glycosyltransferase family 87|nr:glycosyltransferase family 87 protein [Propionibacteriaceae bacterium]